MKQHILFLVCIGLMQPVIANTPDEKDPLIQQQDEESQTITCTLPKGWRWKATVTTLGILGIGGVLGTGGYAIYRVAGGGQSPNGHGLPECNPVPWNRTEAKCESTLPSNDWTPVCAQLGAMRDYSNKTCVPACHWDIQKRRGVFPTGVGKERKLPSEVNAQFHEYEDDNYEYVVCENRQDSWLHRVKSYFTNNSIPYWTTKTEPGYEWHEGGPDIDSYPTEGVAFPKEFSEYVFNEEVYNTEIIENSRWVKYSQPCLVKTQDKMPCTGETGWGW